jgi:hypothetical protein
MRTARIATIAIAALLAAPGAASAQQAAIDSGGPLRQITIGNTLACQVAHTADAAFELFPSQSQTGDCGTFVAVGGVLYGPVFGPASAAAAIGSKTPWSAVSQSGVTGAGTTANPFAVTTVAGGGPVRVTEVDQYIAGQEAYRTDVTVENISGAAITGIVYRGGDCYLQSSDTGFGFVDQQAGAAGCALSANNEPASRIEQWYPITPGANYSEAAYRDVWGQIGSQQPLPNTCRCDSSLDNGAAISWNLSLGPGQRATFAHFTVFSPQGNAGPPAPVQPGSAEPEPTPPGTGPTGRTPPAFGRNGVITGLPSARRCVSRRAFRIRIRKRRGRSYTSASVFLNGRQVAVRRGTRVTAPINLRGLPKGRYTVKIVVVTTSGEVITGTRRYRTCTKKGRGGSLGPL